jgi:CheY-like chemotaxis protein
METIIGACKRGGALAKGLLTFARKGLAEEREVDLNAVVRETVALLERTTLQRIRLVTDLAGDLQRLRGDPAALSHCLMNLCVNAVDAMPDGGTLTLRTRNQSGAALLLEVEDTGTGMSKEVRDRALEPFFTTKPQGKGTGLGLAMVYSTAQAHGGRLELESEPGKGTRVRLVLPASETQREPAGPVSLPVLQAAVQRRPLLLVDDDPLVRDALRAVLKTLGHPATFASGGEEALLLLAGGLLPDAVILDVNMPGLDGAATLAKLRASGAAVPVILVTGRVDDRALGLVDAYPGVTLLAKPFGVGDLQRHLEATLGPLRS